VDIALVGFTRSYNDQQWLKMAAAWVAANEPAMSWGSAAQTAFDLRGEAGRNFLDDRGEYEIVILFAIYNPPTPSPEFQKALGRRRGQTSLALNHSQKNWADQLSRTKAKYVFVFRRDNSVDGQWLGEIDHYQKLPEQVGVFGMSIYARLT